MVQQIQCNSLGSIELDQYIDYVRNSVILEDLESVVASADKLKMLANNKLFFANFLNDELSRPDFFQANNPYSPQSFMLHSEVSFSVRMNIWITKNELRDLRLFAYDLPHDHNFNFLTVGYTGPGYRSETWEYDSNDVIGFAGESVKLRFTGEHHLSPGKVVLYRKGRDIHTQYPPEEISTSINLMVSGDPASRGKQYIFDTTGSTIVYPVDELGFDACRVTLLKAASLFGNENSLSVLDCLSRSNSSLTLRQAAAASFISLGNRLKLADYTR